MNAKLSLVVQWDLPPLYFLLSGTVGPSRAKLPYMHIVPGDTVGLIAALILPYFTISSLLAQWDMSPLLFFPSGTVGPAHL